MTREEAIDRIEDHMRVRRIGEYPHIFLAEALEMAISALRAQQGPVKPEPPNDPLTPEELRGMDGEPVWVHRPTGGMNAVVCVQRDGRILLFGARNGRGEHVDLDDWKGLNMLKIYRCRPEET